jgi:hypothetical protein
LEGWYYGFQTGRGLDMASRRASPYIGCMEHRSGDAFTP